MKKRKTEQERYPPVIVKVGERVGTAVGREGTDEG